MESVLGENDLQFAAPMSRYFAHANTRGLTGDTSILGVRWTTFTSTLLWHKLGPSPTHHPWYGHHSVWFEASWALPLRTFSEGFSIQQTTPKLPPKSIPLRRHRARSFFLAGNVWHVTPAKGGHWLTLTLLEFDYCAPVISKENLWFWRRFFSLDPSEKSEAGHLQRMLHDVDARVMDGPMKLNLYVYTETVMSLLFRGMTSLTANKKTNRIG